MSWLDLLLKQTEEYEAPERYFWWSGLAAISAVARKNIWIDRGGSYKLYPNIYVALISTKSGARKGVPISLCKNILHEANQIRIISGCNSIQGLIQELGSQKTLDSGVVINEAHGILLSSEFDTFLTDDPKALSTLTDLYGTHEHEKGWEKTLKNSPKIFLKSPCLTMLVASNEMLFDSVVKRKDIEGGFIARTILVKESGIRGINPLVDLPKFPINIPELAIRIVEISKIKGEFKWSSAAKNLFVEWYKNLREDDIEDRTGTINRLHDQVVKVTMLISLSKKDSLILEEEDLTLAIEKCETCASSSLGITPSVESSNGDRPNAYKLVIQALITAKNLELTKTELLSRMHLHQVFTPAVDACIEHYMSCNWITRKVIAGKGHINSRTILKITSTGCEQIMGQAKRLRKANEH